MDKTRINHQNQSYNIGKGQALVNLVTGRLLFEYPLLSIGSNNFQISTVLSYSSQYLPSDFGGKKIGLGNGWKLNFHQYLIPYYTSYNIEGFETGDYIYIDSNWCIHRFKLYTTGKYYDTSGTGLRLTISGTSKVIKDQSNNLYEFNNSGNLIGYTSGINPNIKKVLTYNGDKLVSIHDVRKDGRKIEFIYDTNGKLIEVKNTLNCLGFNLVYNGESLKRIDKYTTINGQRKSKYEIDLLYNNGIISYIINSSDGLTLEFNYAQNKVEDLSFTSATREILTEDVDSSIYMGEDLHIGEDVSLNTTAKKIVDYSFNIPYYKAKNKISFSYPNSYTSIKKENEADLIYYYDTEGNTISVLESDFGDGVYTLEKPVGTKLLDNSNTNISNTVKLDGENAKILNSSNSYTYTYNLNITNYGNLGREYKISFWAKVKNANSLKAKLIYETKLDRGDGNAPETVSSGYKNIIFRDCFGETWQHLSTNIKLNSGTQQFSSLKLVFENYTGDDIYIANMRIKKAPSASIMIYDSTKETILNNESSIYFKEVNATSDTVLSMSSNFYMTESDLFNTYKNLFFSVENQDNKYELVYNNGTEVKLVSYAGIAGEVTSQNILFSLVNDSGFGYVPNYYIKTINQIDGNNICVNESIRGILKEENKYYYLLKQLSLEYETNLYNGNRIDESNKNVYIAYSKMNQYGNLKLEKQQRYTKLTTNSTENPNEDSRVLETMVTEYTYDTYGNLELVEIYDLDDDVSNREIFETRYIYDGETVEKRENVLSIIENGETNTFTYEGDMLIKSQTPQGVINYTYDPYYEVVNKNDFLKGDSILSSNITYYNPNGTLKKITNSFSEKYRFGYNKYAEMSKVYKGESLAIEYDYVYGHGITSPYETKVTHKESNVKDKDIYVYNTASQLVSYENKEIKNNIEEIIGSVTYEYNDNSEVELSPRNKRLSKITDGFSGKTYEISYIEEVDHFKTKVKSNDIIITSSSNNILEYTIGNENTVERKVSGNLSNGSIEKSVYKDKTLEKEENDFSNYYFKDKYGRLTKKQSVNVSQSESNTYSGYVLDKTYSYRKNTNYPDCISYNISRYSVDGEQQQVDTVPFGYEIYCNKGRIESMTKNDYDASYKDIMFEYDEQNRLTHEIGERDEYYYEYSNKTGMLENVKANGGIVKSFTYNNGILTKVNNNDIIYDRYGNITKIGDVTIKYNSRGLMESYSYKDNSNNQVEFKYYYNYQGARYKKEKYLNSVIKEDSIYYLNASTILGEDKRTYNNGQVQTTKKLRYYYDAEGICGVKYDNKNYVLVKDPLGNVSKVLCNGYIIGEYLYDAWGNHNKVDANTSSSTDKELMNNNPFRYKGYYYDVETQLFYCNSRYYSPELCRWISPDSIEYLDPQSINGLNLYCYCMNNPIMYADPSGYFPVAAILIGLAVSWAVSSIASYYLGEHLVSGASSVYGGVQTIATGVSLLAYGPVGWVLGGAAIILGAVNIAFGTAELQQHFTGNNWINDIGITGGLYTGLYVGSSLASAAVTIGGTAYMNSSAGKLAYEIQQNAKYWDRGTFHTRYGSMKYHYKTHANGMTPTQYTQFALDFSTFNSSSFRYTYNYKYHNASWNFINMYGVGGYYNSAGKIITFFF